MNLSYEQEYASVETEDVKYQNIIYFAQKLIFELSLDSSYKFIVAYDLKVKNICDTDVVLNKEKSHQCQFQVDRRVKICVSD